MYLKERKKNSKKREKKVFYSLQGNQNTVEYTK
jgi:hypothetical protein